MLCPDYNALLHDAIGFAPTLALGKPIVDLSAPVVPPSDKLLDPLLALIKLFASFWDHACFHGCEQYAMGRFILDSTLATKVAPYSPLAKNMVSLDSASLKFSGAKIDNELIVSMLHEILHIRIIHYTDWRLTTTILVEREIKLLRQLGFEGYIDVLIFDELAFDRVPNRVKFRLTFPKKPDAKVSFILVQEDNPFMFVPQSALKAAEDSIFKHNYGPGLFMLPNAALTITSSYLVDSPVKYDQEAILRGIGPLITVPFCDINIPAFYLGLIVSSDGSAVRLPLRLRPTLASILPSLEPAGVSADLPMSNLFLRGCADGPARYDSLVVRGFFRQTEWCQSNTVRVKRLIHALLARAYAKGQGILLLYCDTYFIEAFEGFDGVKIVKRHDLKSALNFSDCRIIVVQPGTLINEVFQRAIHMSTLPYLVEGTSLFEALMFPKIVLRSRSTTSDPASEWQGWVYADVICDHPHLKPLVDFLAKTNAALRQLKSDEASDRVLADFFCHYNSAVWAELAEAVKTYLLTIPDTLTFALDYIAKNRVRYFLPEALLREREAAFIAQLADAGLASSCALDRHMLLARRPLECAPSAKSDYRALLSGLSSASDYTALTRLFEFFIILGADSYAADHAYVDDILMSVIYRTRALPLTSDCAAAMLGYLHKMICFPHSTMEPASPYPGHFLLLFVMLSRLISSDGWIACFINLINTLRADDHFMRKVPVSYLVMGAILLADHPDIALRVCASAEIDLARYYCFLMDTPPASSTALTFTERGAAAASVVALVEAACLPAT